MSGFGINLARTSRDRDSEYEGTQSQPRDLTLGTDPFNFGKNWAISKDFRPSIPFPLGLAISTESVWPAFEPFRYFYGKAPRAR